MPGKSAGDFGTEPPVFDRDLCLGLAGMIGQQRLRWMMAAFLLDAETRLASLDGVEGSAGALCNDMHAMVSMAGHLGFLRLSDLCRDVQERARDGGGLECRQALRAALADVRVAATDMLTDESMPSPAATAPATLPGTAIATSAAA